MAFQAAEPLQTHKKPKAGAESPWPQCRSAPEDSPAPDPTRSGAVRRTPLTGGGPHGCLRRGPAFFLSCIGETEGRERLVRHLETNGLRQGGNWLRFL